MAFEKRWTAVVLAALAFVLIAAVMGVLVWQRWTKTNVGPETESSAAVVELVVSNGVISHRTVTDFNAFIKSTDKPIFIDFWATWCGPCTKAAPFVETLAREYDGKAIVIKVDVDQAADLAKRYNAQSIPLFVVIKDGQVQDSSAGYAASIENDIRQMLAKQID